MPHKSRWSIYALNDPRTNEVRYIGATTNLPKRIADHLRKCRVSPLAAWLMELGGNNLVPTVDVLESGLEGHWEQSEKKWIAHYRALNAALTNLSSGGKGTIGDAIRGTKLSAATLAKRSASLKGREISEEWRLKLAESHRGQTLSAETRAKLSAVLMGHPVSDETRVKLSERSKGRKVSIEQRQKLSAAHMGKVLSQEHRAKLSAAKAGKPPNNKGHRLSAEQRKAQVELMRNQWEERSEQSKTEWLAKMQAGRRERRGRNSNHAA